MNNFTEDLQLPAQTRFDYLLPPSQRDLPVTLSQIRFVSTDRIATPGARQDFDLDDRLYGLRTALTDAGIYVEELYMFAVSDIGTANMGPNASFAISMALQEEGETPQIIPVHDPSRIQKYYSGISDPHRDSDLKRPKRSRQYNPIITAIASIDPKSTVVIFTDTREIDRKALEHFNVKICDQVTGADILESINGVPIGDDHLLTWGRPKEWRFIGKPTTGLVTPLR